jgi:pyruvate carboxylase subunit B
MKKRSIRFMCTAFRDGFQSVYGARVFSRDFLPAVEAAREAGIAYFEAGGGAMFQSAYFYCNEDAFATMDAFRRAAGPDADLQTLARGVNVVGLESQSSDIIALHARLFKKHGITTIRNFDALNDVNNLIHSGRAIVEAGLKHQVCVTMMELPPGCQGAHDPDFYEKTLRQILDAGIPYDSVCFKDASGTSIPTTVYETIKRARRMLPEGTSIHFHTHETAGISVSAYKAALEAGADAIDLSLAPCSGGTCQPDLLVLWHALRGSNYDLGVDPLKILKVEEVFKDCMKEYFMPPEATAVEPLIPWSPMPGGALTANTQMLRDNGIMDRYPEMIKAMSDVVRAGGFGTSVTPVSQFYFQQAFNNVMYGPWQKIAEPFGRMVLGYFGKTPVPAAAEVVDLARTQLGLEPTDEPVLVRNDRDPKKGMAAASKTLEEEGLATTEENIFITATCGDKGLLFLKGQAKVSVRKNLPEKPASPVESPPAAAPGRRFAMDVGGQTFSVEVDGERITVNGRSHQVRTRPLEGDEPADLLPLSPGFPGWIVEVLVAPGDEVAAGTPLIVIEAMGRQTVLSAPENGLVHGLMVAAGDHVEAGTVLLQLC